MKNIDTDWVKYRLLELGIQALFMPQDHIDHTLSKRITKYINIHITTNEIDFLSSYVMERMFTQYDFIRNNK